MSLICLLFPNSTQDDFMKSSQTQQTMWATDWPVTRRTTQSPTPLPSTLLSRSCHSTPTTPHNQPPQPAAAAAAPPCQKTPSLLRHTPRPSLNTPRCRACLLLPLEWLRTLSPKSSTSELWYKLKPLHEAPTRQPVKHPNLSKEEVVVKTWTIGRCLWTIWSAPLWMALEVKWQCSFCFFLFFWTCNSLFCPVFYCVISNFWKKGRLLNHVLKFSSASLNSRIKEGQVKDDLKI